MKRVLPVRILLAATLSGCTVGSPDPLPPPGDAALLELRLAYLEPGEGLQRIETPDGSLFLGRSPIVTDADLQRASAADSDGNVILSASCTPEADQRLRDATSRHIGSPAAVFWNGELKALPIVRDTVGCAPMQVAWEAPPHEVRAVREEVRRRWSDSPGP